MSDANSNPEAPPTPGLFGGVEPATPESAEIWRRRAEDSSDPADQTSYERALAAVEEQGLDPQNFDDGVVEAKVSLIRAERRARNRKARDAYRDRVDRAREDLAHFEAKLAHYESELGGDE